MKLLGIIILISLFNFSSLKGQVFSFSKEIKFAQYLIDKEQFQDAIQVLHNIDTASLSVSQKDSLFYEIAWFAYSQKKLDTAINYFNKVSRRDYRYHKAIFFATYCNAFLGRYKESEANIIDEDFHNDTTLEELRSFQLAGVSLLKRSFDRYSFYQRSFTYKDYIVRKEEANFNGYNSILKSHKKKSPSVAGLFSAIIPGSGKWYAGKKKQALAAFLPILAAGLLTREAYNKEGFNNVRFWMYGAVFTTLYVGNIWGSTIAVKITNNEFNRKYEQKILFDMHIPLRNFFN